MPFVHGRKTVVTLDSNDLSSSTNTSELTEGRDKHDITGYGADGHGYQSGLKDASITMGGTYFAGATGPKAVIQALIDAGDNVTFVRQPEGVGTGKPQDSASVTLDKYVETDPVADMIKWSLDMSVDGVIDHTPQS